MEAARYTLHRRALMALQQLPDDEQAAVRERLVSLGDLPPAYWPGVGIKTIGADEPIYLLRVNDSLRVFIRALPGQRLEVLDVVRQETLESFAGTRG